MPVRHYLDANATEPLRPEAKHAMLAALEHTGNPSSVHAEGRAARRLLEDARDALAAHFAVEAERVVFCSGGTEANAMAVHGLGQGRRLLVGATEHAAIRAACPAATVLPVGADGMLDLAALEAALPGPPALVCLMLANNETGVLHPIEQAARLCTAHGALLHVDAVQAASRLAFTLPQLGAASCALSSHKVGGPPGAGALLLAHGSDPRPLLAGGGQERGRRGGTPNVPAIVGFAAAVTAARSSSPALRDRMQQAALAAGARVAGLGAPRLPNTLCIGLPGTPAATQLMALDIAGIAVSAGAACSAGTIEPSHVLAAMGWGAAAATAIRVSLPWNATAADADAFIAAYTRLAARRRAA